MTGSLLFYTFMLLLLFFLIFIIRDDSISFLENIYNLKGFIFLYLVLLLSSLYYFNLNDLSIKDSIYNSYGLHHFSKMTNYSSYFICNILHLDFFHLLLNLLFFYCLINLEEYYGWLFFLIFFIIPSLITSIILSYIIPVNLTGLGASNGLLSLFSILIAENLVFDKLPFNIPYSNKIMDFVINIIILLFFVYILTYGYRPRTAHVSAYPFMAHSLGALTGFGLYCILKFLLPSLYDYIIKLGRT